MRPQSISYLHRAMRSAAPSTCCSDSVITLESISINGSSRIILLDRYRKLSSYDSQVRLENCFVNTRAPACGVQPRDFESTRAEPTCLLCFAVFLFGAARTERCSLCFHSGLCPCPRKSVTRYFVDIRRTYTLCVPSANFRASGQL